MDERRQPKRLARFSIRQPLEQISRHVAEHIDAHDVCVRKVALLGRPRPGP
jgi:hypothetical protein